MANHLDLRFRIQATYKPPTNSYEDPLVQRGFVAIKVSEDGPVNNELKRQYGDWIEFTDYPLAASVKELTEKVLNEMVTSKVVEYVAQEVIDG